MAEAEGAVQPGPTWVQFGALLSSTSLALLFMLRLIFGGYIEQIDMLQEAIRELRRDVVAIKIEMARRGTDAPKYPDELVSQAASVGP